MRDVSIVGSASANNGIESFLNQTSMKRYRVLQNRAA